jgi:tetratricopeptide (TPR) repeat protein
MMGRCPCVFIGILLVNCALVGAADLDSGFYDDFSGFFGRLYGIDDNAGLTTLPVLNVPMGGKAEGMAGAFSAVCDDISFIEWNPAGSAMLTNSTLAFFHNNWIADTKLEAVAFSKKIKNFGLAVAGKWLYTPFTEYNEWGDRESKGYYSEAVGTFNVAYHFFPGYYFSGFAVGVNLKGALRFMPEFDEADTSQSGGTFAADAGVLTRINLFKFYASRDKNMSFALTLRNFGLEFMGEPLPTVATAGVAYKPLRPILVSLDFSLPMNFQDFALSEKPYYALGLSVVVTKFLSMRGGFIIKAGGSRITVGSAIELNSVTFDINYSLDLLTQMQPLNRVSIGVRLDLGDSSGLAEKNTQVDKLYLSGLDAYSEGNEDLALENFNRALDINPRFDPAIEAVRSINNVRNINERIKNLENLESDL